MAERVIYSLVVDEHAKFAYQGWHLAKSIIRHCAAAPSDINIQMTPGVTAETARIFQSEGYIVRTIEPFGDKKWCNKIMQLPNLFDEDCDRIVLLDTDMIAVHDLRPFLHGNRVQAKVVDCANPSLSTLLEIMSGLSSYSFAQMLTDAREEQTIVGNANGGFYAIPRKLAGTFHSAWHKWALWLLNHSEPLRKENKMDHVDQVSAAMAFQISGVPFTHAPSNVNYFLHLRGHHRYYDPNYPICLIHYHDRAMNGAGEIEPPVALTPVEMAAVDVANQQIRDDVQTTLRDSYRHAMPGTMAATSSERLQSLPTLA